MNEEENTRRLGKEPVGKLLREFAIPSIIAMAAMSVYNLTDSIFVGHWVGAMGLAGIAVAFPLMNLMGAFGSLIGGGAATLISIRLGEKNADGANAVLGNLTFLAVCFGIALSTFGLIFLKPILYCFGASGESVVFAADYSRIMLFGGVVPFLFFGLSSALRAGGNPQAAMKAMVFSCGINIPLDFIFIYFFHWGVSGAAAATVLSEAAAMIWQIHILSSDRNQIKLKKEYLRPDFSIIKGIVSIGLSAFLLDICSCLEVVFLNNVLQKYGGDIAVGACGIVFKGGFLFLTIIFGICQGMQPIVGYNFGAKQFVRMYSAVKLAILYSTAVAFFGFTLFSFMPHVCARIFTSDPALLAASARALRMTSYSVPVLGFICVVLVFFQSIGKVAQGSFLSIARESLFLLPFLFWFSSFMGVDGVWYSLILADFISFAAASVLFWSYYSKNQRQSYKCNTNNI